MGDAHQRNLVVVTRALRKIRQRIELQQCRGLRRHSARGNRVAWKRLPIARIGNRLRKLSAAHRLVWHQAASRTVIAVARCLVVHEELPLPMEQVRNPERPAERRSGPQVVVRRFLRVLAGERKRPRVQRRIVQNETQVALVHRSQPLARIAEGASLNGPAAAAAHHHGVGRGLVEIARRSGIVSGLRALAGLRRALAGRIHVRALKSRLRIGGGGCALRVRGFLARLGGRSDRRRPRGGRHGRCVNLFERQRLQLPNRAGRAWRHGHFLLEGGEAQHFDLDRPNAIGQAGERVCALLVRDSDEFLVARGRGHRRARNRQTVEVDLSVMLGGRQARHRQPGEGRVPEAVNSQSAPFPDGR